MVISKFGKVLRVEQSGSAGMFPYNYLTKAVGPTMAEVPVSTIPYNPALTMTLPSLMESTLIYQ